MVTFLRRASFDLHLWSIFQSSIHNTLQIAFLHVKHLRLRLHKWPFTPQKHRTQVFIFCSTYSQLAYMSYLALLRVAELSWAGGRMSHLFQVISSCLRCSDKLHLIQGLSKSYMCDHLIQVQKIFKNQTNSFHLPFDNKKFNNERAIHHLNTGLVKSALYNIKTFHNHKKSLWSF